MNEYEPWKEKGITELEYWKEQYIEAREELKVLRRIIELLYKSERAVEGTPLYNLNPSWRTMQCAEAAVSEEDYKLIRDHLKRNDLWEKV